MTPEYILEKCGCPYAVRVPIAPEHLAKLPLPTGNWEDDLLAMSGAVTDDMRPSAPPDFGFVQWELAPPDTALALFTMERGLRDEIDRLRAANAEMLAILQECAEYLDDYSDVIDGDEGNPDPNPAMALLADVEVALGNKP